MNRFVLLGATMVLTLLTGYSLRANEYDKVGNRQVIIPVDKKSGQPKQGQWKVLGWGVNQKAAELDALKKAEDVVGSYLGSLPEDYGHPDAKWIRKHLTNFRTHPPERLSEEDTNISTNDKEYQVLCYTVTIKITDHDLRRLQQERMRDRSLPRVILAGKILVVLVANLLVFVGLCYLRDRFSNNQKKV